MPIVVRLFPSACTCCALVCESIACWFQGGFVRGSGVLGCRVAAPVWGCWVARGGYLFRVVFAFPGCVRTLKSRQAGSVLAARRPLWGGRLACWLLPVRVPDEREWCVLFHLVGTLLCVGAAPCGT